MSIRGLYDSETGDKLARQTLAPFINGAPYIKSGRSRQLCVCGGELARPYIKRKGKYVCNQCAVNIPRNPYKRAATHECSKCGSPYARHDLIVRKGKLYCKRCAK